MRLPCRLLAVLCLPAFWVRGQNLVPNSSFELGTSAPAGWSLYSYAPNEGAWENLGWTGSRSVSVMGAGTTCFRYWKTTSCPVHPGQPYLFSFMARSSNAASGYCLSGFFDPSKPSGGDSVVTRDLGMLLAQWTPYSYIAAIPNNATKPALRVGQCSLNGTFYFDDVAVWPVLPLHKQVDAWWLGDGEFFTNATYVCSNVFGGFTANYSRCLRDASANFATEGWLLDAGRHITYQHGFVGLPFTNAQVQVTLKQQNADLIIEASTNGVDWLESGRFTSPMPVTVTNDLPASLLPATNLLIRLRSTGFFWMTGYRFEGGLAANPPAAKGQSWFFQQSSTNSAVVPVGIASTSGGNTLYFELRNPGSNTQHLAVRSAVLGPSGQREGATGFWVSGFTTNMASAALPFAGEGVNTATITVEDVDSQAVLVQGSLSVTVTRFAANGFGQLLPSPGECPVWWCPGNYKVFQERTVPLTTNTAVGIAAARNDYEPFQVVLRPQTALSNVQVSISDFAYQDGAGVPPISAMNVEFCLVEYVPVTVVYDEFGAMGNYPDPLTPIAGPFAAAAQTNTPVWCTVFVPKTAPAGNYAATMTIRSERGPVPVPVHLEVFNFTLSDVTHTRMGYGVDVNGIWHGSPSSSQRLAIYELYMQNFRKHRASPYFRETSFPPLWVNWSLANGQITHDFTNFDANLGRWLDEYNFNNFWVLNEPDTLGGYTQFTPQYRQFLTQLLGPITAHLRERGWLEKAYCFWIDEPQPHLYPLVMDGMQAHLEAAPGLSRLQATWTVDAALFGQQDLWVQLLSSTLDFGGVAFRRAAGEEIWWFLGDIPKAPLPNDYIDHPAVSPRFRAWMAEKYDIRGELYWYTTWWWGSNSAPRNPYLEPMTRNHPGGEEGNGCGSLLYPPMKTPPSTPLVTGPVNSWRWEMLREAQEDREYFWLIKQLLPRAEARLGRSHPAVVEGYAALDAAMALVPSVSSYTLDPADLYAARARLAAAIVALDDGAPMIVRQPASLAASLGGSVVLRAEVLGWPPPAFQWQLDGTNVPGANTESLRLSNIGPAQLGPYRLVASNAAGMAISDTVQLAGRWVTAPQILTQPKDMVRWKGEHVVFAVTAVSSSPLSYTWLFNGTPLPAGMNATLLLTNLVPSMNGGYSAIVSNAGGALTSLVARLTVPVVISNYTIVPAGSVWRYCDLGWDLGVAWRYPGYDDSWWSKGPAQLGYGDGDEQTVVSYGPDPANKYPTTYFRLKFVMPTNVPPLFYAVLRVLKDDAALVFLNGTEVYRSGNLPLGPISYNQWAVGFWDQNPVISAAENTFFPIGVAPEHFLPGVNVLAVEVHQYAPDDDDLSFDLELVGTGVLPPQILSPLANQIQWAGGAATFAVTAASGLSPSYQWLFNGVPVAGATNAAFSLANLGTNQAGSYSVRVSNSAGVTISAPVTLTVVQPQPLQGQWLADGAGLSLQIPASPVALTVQASSNLLDWVTLLSLPASMNPTNVVDTGVTNAPSRFYRLWFSQ